MAQQRFDLEAARIKGADVRSFTLRHLTRDDEFVALRKAEQMVGSADGRAWQHALVDAKVMLSVVAVDDAPVDQGTFEVSYARFNDKTRSLIYNAWAKMNAIEKDELDRLFASADTAGGPSGVEMPPVPRAPTTGAST